MKKLFFAALVVAGTTLGFAKDNMKDEVETSTAANAIISSKKEAKQILNISKTDSLKKTIKKATCTDIHGFYQQVELPNGDTDYVYTGSVEITYECDNAQISLYIWID